MYRSFTNHVFGGVCGGLARSLRINAWWVRAAFLLLALLTQGAFALLYLVLWWLVPQQSPVLRRRGGAGNLLITLVLIVVTAIGWLGRAQGWLEGPSGQEVFWPALLLLVATAFFLRQVRV